MTDLTINQTFECDVTVAGGSFAVALTGGRGATRPSPTSVLIDGDSYLDPAGVGVAANDAIGERMRRSLGLDTGHWANLAVSGSQLRLTYYRTWHQLEVRRSAAPYVSDVGAYFAKWLTNDAFRGTSAAQEYGVKAAMRAVWARVQGGSFYGHTDTTISQVDAGWTALAWVDLAAEPFDVEAKGSGPPGSGTGCWRSTTVGSVKTVTVPADHTGAIDLFFVGGPVAGGVVTIKVDGVTHGTLTTSGCGPATFVVSQADERVGLVYRIPVLAAGARTVTITVTSLFAGTVANPGEIWFDSWSIVAEVPPPIFFAECPVIPAPSGLWASVTEAVCVIYTDWVRAVAAEAAFNGAADKTYPVCVVPLLRASTVDGNPGGAGHPNALGSAVYAALFLQSYGTAAWPYASVLPYASWSTDPADAETGSLLIKGVGAPSQFSDDFARTDSALAIGNGWTAGVGTAGISSGQAYLAASTGNAFTRQSVFAPSGATAGSATMTRAGVAQTNCGFMFRASDALNCHRVVSSAFGWVYQRLDAGVIASSVTLGGSTVAGVVLKVVWTATTCAVYVNDIQVGATVTISGHVASTLCGFTWAFGATTHRWEAFTFGVLSAPDAAFYIDSTTFNVWGPSVANSFGAAPISLPAGTETASGILELATLAEVATGTDATRVVTPVGLKAVTDTLTTAVNTQLAAKEPITVRTLNTQTGDYTLVLGDAVLEVRANKATAVAFTIPPQSSVVWTASAKIPVSNIGVGPLTLTPGAGVTIVGDLIIAQYGAVQIERTASNTWLVKRAGIPKATLTAAGDLLTATAASVPSRLGIGTAFQLLRVNSAATAPEWQSGGMHLVAETTVSSAVASIALSIPAGYRGLRIVLTGRTTRAATSEGIIIDYNTDITSANYDNQRLTAINTTVAGAEVLGAAGSGARQIGILAGSTAAAGLPGTIIVDIPDYAGTTYHKVAQARTAVWATRATGGITHREDTVLWASTAAIATVTFRCLNGNNFDVGTHAVAYGIG